MVEAVRAAGGTARLTMLPDAGHDVWTETYADSDIYDWLLEHQRSAAGPA
jgi:predicted peptidase